MSNSHCPNDHQLLRVLAGDHSGRAVLAHLRGCGRCLGRLARLHAEVRRLRALADGHTTPAPPPDFRPPDAGRPSSE